MKKRYILALIPVALLWGLWALLLWTEFRLLVPRTVGDWLSYYPLQLWGGFALFVLAIPFVLFLLSLRWRILRLWAWGFLLAAVLGAIVAEISLSHREAAMWQEMALWHEQEARLPESEREKQHVIRVYPSSSSLHGLVYCSEKGYFWIID